MNKFNEIILKIQRKIIDEKLFNYINNLLKNWFINLNSNDINILTVLATFISQRIIKLFNLGDLYFKQLSKNNNQDIKAIILLLLPFINDEKINVYVNLRDLNELILSKQLNKLDLELDRSQILSSHFKYTNMGIGLFDENNELNLFDPEFGKLIYKICYYNFIELNETISKINGKMYINWLNIFPITIEKYKESNIYKDTVNNIDRVINNSIDLLDYNGLYIGEFYNIYRNIYYESIKKIKWLIFIINKKYIIKYIETNFNFLLFFEYNNYDDLNKNDKNNFNLKIEEINLNDNDIFLIWKSILLFLINSNTYKKILKEELKEVIEPFIMNIEEEDRDNDIKYNYKFDNIKIYHIDRVLKEINIKYIWNFIKDSLIIFNNTIYSKLDDTKLNNINLKNIYNIAKSLSYDSEDNKWILLPNKYSNLDEKQKTNFWEKFNQTIDNEKWINIKKNLIIQEGVNLLPLDYNLKLDNIIKNFNLIKYDLVWEYLIYFGLLSEFKVNLKFTSFNYNKKDFFKNNFKIDKEYDNAYYYLTNKMYKDHNFRIEKDKQPIEINYFKNLANQLWYTFYAMDWITQINFFHHYFNHKILYITGATGQGKSTQVPKLLIYALKAYDYKNNGKVVCTQPRIGPTNSNANRISEELGVPIEQFSATFKDKVKSNNYYVQLSHSADTHIKLNCQHPTLKISTDGTLLTEIIKFPNMKEKIKEEVYGNNIYDIIIVDEAHEHNTNMDLILTLGRQTCYMNEDIKLVIMSATMDDDEPIFRKYYDIIKGNSIESKYLDRRFHIAPPGQSTQYTITEIYEPNSNINDVVKKIIDSSNFGHILAFENGTVEIIKRVKELNEITPKNIIAIPYFSILNNYYKLLIEIDLHKNISKIRTAKNKVHEIWSENFIESNDVPENTYDRCIVVATNVAEASITIENLKFVIDNGYAKVNSYDYFFDITKLEAEEISEASRKQRKGRVGRTSSGTVYYLYEKGARENIKPKYKINQENFGYNLIKLLETKNINENLEIISKDKEYMIRKESGYELKLLLDLDGMFYLIHPFENKLKRNILNNIIEYKDNKNNFVKLKKVLPDYYFENLLLNMSNKYFIVNMKFDNKDYNNYYKTEFIKLVEEMNELLDWQDKTFEDIIIILTSKAYGSFDEVLLLLTLIKSINNSTKNLTININQDNELENLYKIIKEFKNDFYFLNIFKIKDYKNIFTKNINDVNKLINDFINDYKKNIIDPPKNKYNIKIWNKLATLYNNGNLNSEKGFMNLINDLLDFNNFNDFYKYKNEIIKWCELRNIKGNSILKFLKEYKNVFINILTIKKKYDIATKDPLEKISLESSSFQKSLTYKNEYEKIIRPFLHGYTTNIGIRCNNIDKFHKTFNGLNIANDTKINNYNIIFYYTKKESNNKDIKFEISITNKIEIEWLFNILPNYYKPSNLKNKLSGDLYDDFLIKFNNKWTINNIPFDSHNMPILKHFLYLLKKNLLITYNS